MRVLTRPRDLIKKGSRTRSIVVAAVAGRLGERKRERERGRPYLDVAVWRIVWRDEIENQKGPEGLLS